jgi:class 3 adenylate cyclase
MQPSPELEAIIRRFLAARQRGDMDAVTNLFSTSEHLLAVGSDEEDWYMGPELRATIARDWTEHDVDVDTVRRIEAFEHGETGWVVVEAERRLPSGHTYVYRLTEVLVLEGGSWRVVHWHWSLPVGHEIVQAPDLNPTLADLLGTLGQEGEETTRTATVVFTDIVGSTPLSQSMGDTAWSTVIGAHFDRLRAAVEAHHGREVKTLGDGGMYVFDTAGSALGAIAAIRAEDDLPIRIGAHTGDVVARGSDVLGASVAKAARVASAAGGGQALVSATTAGIANPAEFSFGPPITLELTGLTGTHVVHELR